MIRAGSGTVCHASTALVRSKPYYGFFSEKHHIGMPQASTDHTACKYAITASVISTRSAPETFVGRLPPGPTGQLTALSQTP